MPGSTQRTCPKCFKLNDGENSICDGCGADISQVPVRTAQGRRSIFGYVATGNEEPSNATAQAPRQTYKAPEPKRATPVKTNVYAFAEVCAPTPPW